MGPADHHHTLVRDAQHGTHDDVRLVERQARHGDVDLATAQRTEAVVERRGAQLHRGTGVPCLEALDGAAQDLHARGGVQQPYANDTRPGTSKLGGSQHPVETGHRGDEFGVQRPPGVGQFDDAAGAAEQQLTAQLPLKRPHGLADARGGQTKAFGGTPEMQLLGENEEQSQLTQLNVRHR